MKTLDCKIHHQQISKNGDHASINKLLFLTKPPLEFKKKSSRGGGAGCAVPSWEWVTGVGFTEPCQPSLNRDVCRASKRGSSLLLDLSLPVGSRLPHRLAGCPSLGAGSGQRLWSVHFNTWASPNPRSCEQRRANWLEQTGRAD